MTRAAAWPWGVRLVFTKTGLRDCSRRFQYQVELDLRVGLIAVEDRRNPPAVDADQAADQLDRAAARDQVAHVALERRHGNAARPEDPLERPGFRQVGDLGGRAVGVDVADIRRRQAGFLEGGGDGDLGAAAVGIEPAGGHGVAARAAAQDLAVDPGPAVPGVLFFLEDQDARPLAGNPAVATAVERPAGLRRLALPPRHVLEQAHPDHARADGSWNRRRR